MIYDVHNEDEDCCGEEFELFLITNRSTDKAYCVCQEVPDFAYGNDDRFWLPKSQIIVKDIRKVTIVDKSVPVHTKTISFLAPEWLAIEKGLL